MSQADNAQKLTNGVLPELARDDDPQETAEWLEALDYVCQAEGRPRAQFLLERLKERAFRRGVPFVSSATTPYVNTIPADQQPVYPGDRDMERKIKSIIRWNAMAMVVRANKESPGIGGHISTYRLGRHALRSRLQPLPPRQAGAARPRSGLLPGPRLAGHLCAGVSAGPDQRAPTEEFPPRVGPRRRPVVVSAPLAHARLLGIPHRLDGLGPDHGHLPGPLQPLPGRSGHQARRRGVAGMGVSRRRRMRRARGPGRHYAGRPRAIGQPDLRRQLQPAAAGRPGPRQRQDRPGAGRGLPRRRLERHQGPLGLELGPAAGPRHRGPVGPPDGRGRRRRVSEIHRHARLVHPRAFLRRRSAAEGAWSPI